MGYGQHLSTSSIILISRGIVVMIIKNNFSSDIGYQLKYYGK